MPQWLQNVVRKQKGHAAYWTSDFYNHVLDIAINIFLKFHVKIKFWSKVIVHEIRGTNFWDTLYISFIEIKNLIKNLQLHLAKIPLSLLQNKWTFFARPKKNCRFLLASVYYTCISFILSVLVSF